MMRSGNPALRDNTFSVPSIAHGGSDTMTIQGTVNKSFIMLIFFNCIMLMLLLATAYWSWYNPQFAGITMIGGFIGGFVLALVIIFKKTTAPYLAPIYALLEGLALGGLSLTFEVKYPGIVLQAVGLTFAVFAALLFAYKSKLIHASENFKLGVAAATGGIAIFYLVGFVLSLFGVHAVSSIHSVQNSSMLSIGISLVVVVVAALNLVMDFDFIENGERQKAPKFMEWYGAFGLIVTLIWLYLEMLRLLAKINGRK